MHEVWLEGELQMTPEQAWFIFGLVTTAASLAIARYFPGCKEAGRKTRYTVGTACIFAGIGVWLVSTDQLQLFIKLCAFPLLGGFVVKLLHGHDAEAEQQQRIEEGKQKVFEAAIDERD